MVAKMFDADLTVCCLHRTNKEMVRIIVKWGKETFDIDVDTSLGSAELKSKLEARTSVPQAKQKIMGVKGGQLKDDCTSLEAVGLAEGKTIMLIGTVEELPPPPAAVVFAEDKVGGHDAEAPTTNGLVNIGNTCYMNSAIQALRIIPELRPILADPSTPPMGKCLLELFSALDNKRDAVPPMQMWLTLMATFPNFAETDNHGHPMQHDSQEALAAFLQVAIQRIEQSPELRAKYGGLFNGTFVSRTTTVGDAEASRADTSPFGILTCNIAGEAQTLEAALEQSFEETISEEGSDKIIKRINRFAALPEYLFVHMVRFQWRRDIKAKTKILKPINFPLVLDVLSLCSDELKESMKPQREKVKAIRDRFIETRKRQRQKSGNDPSEAEDASEPEIAYTVPDVLHNDNGFYELCGVISHKGRDSDGGHYVAWVLKGRQWLVVDDNHSAPVSVEDVLRLRGVGEAHIGYVLLYRSRDPNTQSLPLLI